MRLSLSGKESGEQYDLGAIMATDNSGGNVPGGRVLNDFAEAVMARSDGKAAGQRQLLVAELGEPAMVDAAAVIAAFNLVARVADATGLPLEDYKEEASVELRDRLGLNEFAANKQ